MNTKEYIALEEQYGAHNYHPLDVVVHEAEGAWVTDVEGKKYLDCLAAYSAVNQGHCHPGIYEVFTKQAKKVTLTRRDLENDCCSVGVDRAQGIVRRLVRRQISAALVE